MIFKKCNPSHIHLLWSFITMKCGCWPWLVCNKKEMISGLNKLWQPLAAKVSLITLTRIIWLPYINLWIQEDYYPCTQVTTVGAAAASGYSSKVLYCPAAAGESGYLVYGTTARITWHPTWSSVYFTLHPTSPCSPDLLSHSSPCGRVLLLQLSYPWGSDLSQPDSLLKICQIICQIVCQTLCYGAISKTYTVIISMIISKKNTRYVTIAKGLTNNLSNNLTNCW